METVEEIEIEEIEILSIEDQYTKDLINYMKDTTKQLSNISMLKEQAS